MDLNEHISSQYTEPMNNDQMAEIFTEEIKVEKEIIKAIKNGDLNFLKPNSGEPIYIGDNYVCVSFYDDPREGYTVWEWHGHILSYSVDRGYTRDHIFGYYYEDICYEEEVDTEERGEFGLKDFMTGFFIAGAILAGLKIFKCEYV